MIAIAPYPAVSAGRTVDREGATAGEALNPSGQGPPRVCLDHEMKVIDLDREMDDSKVAPVRAHKRGQEP